MGDGGWGRGEETEGGRKAKDCKRRGHHQHVDGKRTDAKRIENGTEERGEKAKGQRRPWSRARALCKGAKTKGDRRNGSGEARGKGCDKRGESTKRGQWVSG